MKINTFALAAVLSALAGAALADGPARADLVTPIAKPIDLIAGDGYWRCQGSTCASGAATDQSLSIEACRTIVKAVGPVTAYVVGGGSLRPAALARCNAAAPAAKIAEGR